MTISLLEFCEMFVDIHQNNIERMRSASVVMLGGKAKNSMVDSDRHNYEVIDVMKVWDREFRRCNNVQRLAVRIQISVEGRVSVMEQQHIEDLKKEPSRNAAMPAERGKKKVRKR